MKMVAIGQNSHSSGVVAEKSTRLVAAAHAAMVRAVMNQMCWLPKYANLSSSDGAWGRFSTTGARPGSGRHVDRSATDTGATVGAEKVSVMTAPRKWGRAWGRATPHKCL